MEEIFMIIRIPASQQFSYLSQIIRKNIEQCPLKIPSELQGEFVNKKALSFGWKKEILTDVTLSVCEQSVMLHG